MEKYPKIETLLDRDETTFKVIPDQWRLPEFEYLRYNPWLVTEKVNGTNVRVHWDGESVTFRGRTDNAQMPGYLLERLTEMFPVAKFKAKFDSPVTLYGEGYGAKIQKGGGLYIPDGVSFLLFDVRIGEWWLRWVDVEDVGMALSVPRVPALSELPLTDIVNRMREERFDSCLKSGLPEGVVVRPLTDLRIRAGHRLMGKLKYSDF